MTKKRISLATIEELEPEWLRKIHIPNWIVLVLGLIFLFRVPSLFEPYYHHDEMVSLTAGIGMNQGLSLYKDIYVDNSPLLYLIAAISGNLFWFRAILALWMMITTVFFYKLAEILFPKKHLIVLGATVAFAILTTIPLFEGQIAHAEAFALGPTIAAFHILLSRELTKKNLLIAGVLFSISALFKVPSVFDIGAVIFIWIVSPKRGKYDVSQFIRQSLFLLSGFIVPILFTFVWYAFGGSFNEYLTAAFLQNKEFYAPLIVRGVFLGLGLVILYMFRKKLSGSFLFAAAWLIFSLFAATLSATPNPHHLIQVVPSVSLLIGVLLASQSIEQPLPIIPLFLFSLSIVYFQFAYQPIASYYQRFLLFNGGQITKEEYFAGFDKNATRNYEIAQYLLTSSNEREKVFVWGDSPTIYALSKRLPPTKYLSAEHINRFSTQDAVFDSLVKTKPKFVITLPSAPDFPSLEILLQSEYLLIDSLDGAQIWKAVGVSVNSLLK